MSDRELAQTPTTHPADLRGIRRLEVPPKSQPVFADDTMSGKEFWETMFTLLFFGGCIWLWVGGLIGVAIDPGFNTSLSRWLLGTSLGSIGAAIVIATILNCCDD